MLTFLHYACQSDTRKVTAAADRKRKSRNPKLATLKQWDFVKSLQVISEITHF